MKVFFSNYHISVNKTLVGDLLEAGLEVVLPDDSFHPQRIEFFASNEEHRFAGNGSNVHIVDYPQLLGMEPMAILIPCMQHIGDFQKLWEERGRVDKLVYLTANSDAWNTYPHDADFVMTHDIDYHRLSDARYKILYWNQPTFAITPKSDEDIRRTFDEKRIKLYVNNFYKGGFEPEIVAAEKFRELWKAATGVPVPFYGYDNPDGWPQPPETHEKMRDSMFTLCFKRRETWGQMVNESMQLGTPCIFYKDLMYSTFKSYLITPEVAVVSRSIEDMVDRLVNMTFEQYETMVREAQWTSRMYCNDEIRIEKVKWLFGKVEAEL